MVTTTGVGSTQTYQQPQPNFNSATESRANTEQVQPREAPAAQSQRADRKLQSREDDTKRQNVVAQRSSENDQASQAKRADGRRGSIVDLSV